METEKGKTYKYLREKREVSPGARDRMKQFSKIRKSILEALQDGELTIKQLSQKTGLPSDIMVFYLMSLLKYGLVETAGLDDMDEYFSYKLKR